MMKQILGVRELRYRVNEPIVARYIICDGELLDELDERFDFRAKPDTVIGATQSLLHEYEHVIRFRDTRVYHDAYQQAIRKVKEGIAELVALRLLEGEDQFVIQEDTLAHMGD